MLDFGPGSFFLTPSQLVDSPSARHGVSAATEKALRLYACEIIQEAGILLRLPQAVAATAQVLFHRFFCKQSFRDFDARTAAASCFWLSMKLEEEEGASNRGRKPSQLNDVISMFEHIRARREGTSPLPQHAPTFKIRKEELLKLETRILVELGFVCHVEHPHKLLLGILTVSKHQRNLFKCVGIWQSKSQFVDVRTPSSKPVQIEIASSSSEPSPVAASSKSPESEASHLISTPAVNSADVVSCGNDVPLISPASASNMLNSCFMNASGLPSSKLVDGAPVHQVSSESMKRPRESCETMERKSKRSSSSHERSYSNHEREHERWDRRRHYRHAEGSHRGICRDYERNSNLRKDYSRCSSSC